MSSYALARQKRARTDSDGFCPPNPVVERNPASPAKKTRLFPPPELDRVEGELEKDLASMGDTGTWSASCTGQCTLKFEADRTDAHLDS